MKSSIDPRGLLGAVLLILLFSLLAANHGRAADIDIAVVAPADQWAPTMFAPGSTASFSIATSPAPDGPYQWFFNGTPVPGATASTLVLSNLTTAQTGNYRLRCSPAAASPRWSQTLTLNVLPTPPSRVDRTFTAAGIDGDVYQLWTTRDGQIVVSLYGGGYLRLNANGSRDESFAFPASAGSVLAVLPDGGLITSQAPWHFDASAQPAPLTLPASLDLTLPFAAAVQSDGKFLLGQGATLIRFSADGTVDPTFNYTPPMIAYRITAVDVDLHDRLIVHRQTDLVDGDYQTSIVRLLASGSVDATFAEEVEQKHVSAYNMNIGPFIPLPNGYLVTNQTFSYYNLHFVSDGGLHDLQRGITHFAAFSFAVDPSGRIFRADGDALVAYNLTDSSLALDSAYRMRISGGTLTALLRLPDGKLLVAGKFTSLDGHLTTGFARLSSSDAPITPIPTLTATYSDGYSDHLRAGFPCSLVSTGTGGSSDYVYQWLALDGQPLPSDTSSPTLTFPAFTRAQLGRYQLRVTGPYGSTLSPVIELTDLEETYPRLVNLSGRARVGTGEDAAIAGVVLGSDQDVLVRGAGPALQPLGVADLLPDPTLSISAGTASHENDNWQVPSDPYLTAFISRAGAFAFADASLDSAWAGWLAQGPHTALLRDRTNRSGVGLVEIYSDPEDTKSPLLNLSLRAQTAPGEATAIAGFVIDEPQHLGRTAKLLLRAIGPTLSTQGIVHPLENPILTVYDAHGTVVARNDDWFLSPASNPSAAADLTAAAKKVGAFDLTTDSHDAALLLDLPAGAYSMHATGGTGVVLLEIYLVR